MINLKRTQFIKEFVSLKKELFGSDMFVVLDETDPKVQRYNQLLGYCYPNFRTDDWKNPEETN